MNLSLGDVASSRGDEIFDGILEGDDVILAVAIDLIDECRQRRAFSASDRAGYKNEAVLVLGQQLELRREAQFIHRPDPAIDDSEDEVVAQPLPNHAGSESAERGRVGKINIAAIHELGFLFVIEEPHGEALGVLVGQDRCLLPDGLQEPEATPDWNGIDAEMDIGGIGFLADHQILIDVVERVDFLLAYDFNGGGFLAHSRRFYQPRRKYPSILHDGIGATAAGQFG